MDSEALPPSVDHSAEALFRRGCLAHEAGQWEHARELFEKAVSSADSDPHMLWRVTESCLDSDEAASWMRRAVVTESEPGGITVDPEAFGILGGGGRPLVQNWEIVVESDEPAGVVAALTAAEPRLMRVFEDGRELSPEAAEELWDDACPPYSPNYAAVDATVPRIWMDCKDGIYPHMARTALRIVTDELRKAGVRRAHLFSRPDR
ncbi:tetratricopeptide repeat protein [Kitasatospora sp. NBC_01560]|uniref:tetratricopeptide repeat protein n=1 Tax=Kitasatospora sp. NBC_01560 TaxID=2975965 RepID=UPI00386901B3